MSIASKSATFLEPVVGYLKYEIEFRHGRYLFGDGMISTPTVLSDVRLSKAASESLDGHPRQWHQPNAEDVQSFNQQLQAEMERRLQQQREEMEQNLKQECEEMDHKLHQEREMERK
jgi:hypothetical protein